MPAQMVTSKTKVKVTFSERMQRSWDKLIDRYEEEGIPACGGEFKIDFLTAIIMTAQAIRNETGRTCKVGWLRADDLIDREVYPGVFVDKRGISYYLVYENSEIMTEFIEDYLLLNKRQALPSEDAE